MFWSVVRDIAVATHIAVYDPRSHIPHLPDNFAHHVRVVLVKPHQLGTIAAKTIKKTCSLSFTFSRCVWKRTACISGVAEFLVV